MSVRLALGPIEEAVHTETGGVVAGLVAEEDAAEDTRLKHQWKLGLIQISELEPQAQLHFGR